MLKVLTIKQLETVSKMSSTAYSHEVHLSLKWNHHVRASYNSGCYFKQESSCEIFLHSASIRNSCQYMVTSAALQILQLLKNLNNFIDTSGRLIKKFLLDVLSAVWARGASLFHYCGSVEICDINISGGVCAVLAANRISASQAIPRRRRSSFHPRGWVSHLNLMAECR